VLLGGPTPVAWAAVIAVGTVVAGLGGLRLGRRLPANVNRPPVDVPA
jgi:hypothetical protein